MPLSWEYKMPWQVEIIALSAAGLQVWDMQPAVTNPGVTSYQLYSNNSS